MPMTESRLAFLPLGDDRSGGDRNWLDPTVQNREIGVSKRDPPIGRVGASVMSSASIEIEQPRTIPSDPMLLKSLFRSDRNGTERQVLFPRILQANRLRFA
jgi:hypothetical protein